METNENGETDSLLNPVVSTGKVTILIRIFLPFYNKRNKNVEDSWPSVKSA